MAEKTAVIVVDDDHAVRESLKFDLELEGLCVQALAGGAELLAYPDLDQAATESILRFVLTARQRT